MSESEHHCKKQEMGSVVNTGVTLPPDCDLYFVRYAAQSTENDEGQIQNIDEKMS